MCRIFEQGAEGTPFTHVVGHDNEYAGQTGYRDMSRQGAEEEQNKQEHGGMDKPGHRRASAVVDIRYRAGDGAGDGYPTENGDDDVGSAARKQP